MNWEEEIEHIIHSFEKEIEEDKFGWDKNTYMYIKGHAEGQKSVISRLQIALDEARKNKTTD